MTLILLAISLTITFCVIAWHLAIYALPVMTGITAFQYVYATGSGFWLSALAAIGAAVGSIVLVMVVELLNTGIEAAIDRIGPQWHELSKRAKDMGSAAVLLSLLLCAGIWAAALFQRFFHG